MKSLITIIVLSFFTICNVLGQNKISPKDIWGQTLEIQTEKPIANCIIFLYEVEFDKTSMTVTDSTGSFVFRNISSKTIKLTATHISYDGAVYGPVNLPKNYSPKIIFELTPVAYQTDDVVITDKRLEDALSRNGFYRRKNFGYGKFLTSEDIKVKNATRVVNIFQNIPGIFIKDNEIYTLRSPGINHSSKLNVYIDGMLVIADNETGIDLDRFVEIKNIAGIEIYRGRIETPLQYGGQNKASGVILIWTKK